MPQEAPDTDSDIENEMSVDVSLVMNKLSNQLFSRPHATGRDRPPYEMLDAMTPEDGKDRLIFVDYVYPLHKQLKAGITVFLLLLDYKTNYVMLRCLVNKDQTIDAFGEIAIERGWIKTAHVVHAVSDGEPKLHKSVADACLRLGMSHSTSVANRPQSNRAGANIVRSLRRAVACALHDASANGTRTINGTYEAIAWRWAVGVHNLMVNKNDVHNRSPQWITDGVKPTYNLAPPFAPGFMTMGKDARRAHVKRGGRPGEHTAEPVLWLEYREGQHRVMTMRGSSRSGPVYLDVAGQQGVFPGETPLVQPQAQSSGVSQSPAPPVLQSSVPPISNATSDAKLQAATIDLLISADDASIIRVGKKRSNVAYIQLRCDAIIGFSVADALKMRFQNSAGHMALYRRCDLDYDLKGGRIRIEIVPTEASGALSPADAAILHSVCVMAVQATGQVHEPDDDEEPHERSIADIMAQKNLNWKQFLAGGPENVAAATEAEAKEMLGIKTRRVMLELEPGTPRYEIALREASNCNTLLDKKQGGLIKVRCVQLGNQEKTDQTDGEGYDYYAAVAGRAALRIAILQAGRYDGVNPDHWIEASSVDIKQAFLQSFDFDDGRDRYLKVRSPIDHRWRYYQQFKPLYGSRSAPIRWQNTFVEWATKPVSEGGGGLVRGHNERSMFTRKATATTGPLILVLWVDDIWLTGRKTDQLEFYVQLDKRFDTNGVTWLLTGVTIDHVGMQVHQCENYTWILMSTYIVNMQVILNMQGCKPMYVPMIKGITDMKELSASRRVWFRTGLGMCGWLANHRPDGVLTYNRIAQYQAAPNQGAYDAVVNLVRYYVTTVRLGIRQPLRGSKEWEFFCDSDLGGNAEPINKRRSQMGGLAIQGEAPMIFSARVTTVALGFSGLPAGFRSDAGPVTANSAITAEHATTSSAESETYSLALFANDLLALSYVVEEAGLVFPRPAVVQVDNTAAIAFSRSTGSNARSRMRHIDLRLAWVRVLRESGLITCVHVDTKNQLADIFTKILDQKTFIEIRDKLMHYCPG